VSWYRFAAVVACCVFIAVLVAAPVQAVICALALGQSGRMAILAARVWRWAARGALVPGQPTG
jgi:hypothetical protein